MKGILAFELPEDTDDFRIAQQGQDIAWVIADLFSYLRAMEKYEDKEHLSIEEIREKMVELIAHYELTDILN